MRETTSGTQFHGLLGSLANSDRSAHWARGLDFKLRCPVQEVPLFREADLSVSSSLSRDRVMEARFDVETIQLPDRARAIDGSMFHREAWEARLISNTRTSFQVML